MSNKKQTAVEWLENKLNLLSLQYELPEDEIDELLEQAKEMEKEQIIDAYHINPKETKWDNKGIEYYKETYDK